MTALEPQGFLVVECETAALHHALAAVYSGAEFTDAEAVADQLDDIGFEVAEIPPREPTDEVLAFAPYRSNAELIAAVARLGYLRPTDAILDPTWGRGTFWKAWKPTDPPVGLLLGSDLDPTKGGGDSIDFRHLPWQDRRFDAVVFDPPYKLNGTPTADVDERYGVHVVSSREDRHHLILDGIVECARVCKRTLLVKCQDQVNGGKVRWQTRIFADHAEAQGFELVDRFDILGHRPQPAGRRQVHARRNASTLLVLERVTP